MIPTHLLRHIASLPSLIAPQLSSSWAAAETVTDRLDSESIHRVYIAGCGDSHHAAISVSLAFGQFAALPTSAQTSMQFARYAAQQLPADSSQKILVIGISASGEVSRTIEALEQAKRKGATTVALTGNETSRLGKTADLVMSAAIPALPEDAPSQVIPGARSYFASLLALYALAIRLGSARNILDESVVRSFRGELTRIGKSIGSTIQNCSETVGRIARQWLDQNEFVFCGAGPNYGTALFSAAKILEASGDAAMGQDLEEWAHLQYFARKVETPTVLISGGSSDQDRAREIAVAAQTIGRSLAVIADDTFLQTLDTDPSVALLPTASCREAFSPLVACIPALLLASELAGLRREPYFRDFGGGRNREEGGGISRIRTSHRLD